MKILQLCNKVPYPEKDGGAIGISVFTKALLKAGNDVKMLAMNTSKHFVDIDSIPKKLVDDIKLETVFVNTSLNPVKALLCLFMGRSYNIARFRSKAFENKLIEAFKKETFDIIQLEGLYLTPYIIIIRAYSKAKIVLREHNVEWVIWERLAKEEKNFFKKLYLRILAKQLKTYEKSVLSLCDGITTTTTIDKQKLQEMGCKAPIAHIPFGIDIQEYKPTTVPQKLSLFYIGALDWLPNIQGLDWFLGQVWSKIHSAYPNIEFHIAGRNMPEKYRSASHAGVVFHGEVESALQFMNSYSVMVIPLLAGSGVRVKIIEGMALGKPIITTGIGIEGIECQHQKDVLIANTPEDFFTLIKQCADNTILVQSIAESGNRYARTHHDITAITNNLLLFYKELASIKI